MWKGFIQSDKDLTRTKSDLPWARGDSASLMAHPADFRLAGLRNHMGQFLQINLSLSPFLFLSLSTHTHTHTHTLLGFGFSIEPWLLQEVSRRHIHTLKVGACSTGNPISLTAAEALLLSQGHHLGWTVPWSTWHHRHPLQRSLMHHRTQTGNSVSRIHFLVWL